MVKFSREPAVATKSAKAMASDLRTSFKNMFETATAIKGMNLMKAIKYLQDVREHKQCIPYRRFVGNIGRTAQAKAFKHTQGRWPEKSCRRLLDILTNLKANAETKGLNIDELFVVHVQVDRAVKGRRRTFKAHGRIKDYASSNCHVQLFVAEKEKVVPKPEKKIPQLTKKQAARQQLKIGGAPKKD